MKTVAILEPTLLALRMDYRLLRRLPVDPSTDGWISSRIVPSCCFSVTYPTPLTRPVVVALSPSVWKQLDIDKIAKPNPEDPLNDPALVERIDRSVRATWCSQGRSRCHIAMQGISLGVSQDNWGMGRPSRLRSVEWPRNQRGSAVEGGGSHSLQPRLGRTESIALLHPRVSLLRGDALLGHPLDSCGCNRHLRIHRGT
jgi:hypothetical protein